MNIKIKYCLLTLVIAMLFTAGCSARDSGLYRLETGTEGSGAGDSEAKGSVADRSESDTGYNSTDSAEGLSADRIESSSQTVADVDSESTSVSPEVNNSAPEGTPVTTLQADILYVHVCGAVNTPGVYELKNGDRVFTAIRKAGGFTEEADESYINLAMAVCDGMKIDVPTVEETSGDRAGQIQAVMTAGVSGDMNGYAATGASPDKAASASGAVNINTADVSGLTTISGIGKTRAEAIIAYREEHGAFLSVEDIRNVSGIGDATYEKIKDRITVD